MDLSIPDMQVFRPLVTPPYINAAFLYLGQEEMW